MYVAVVGPGQDAGERDCDQAREVGRLLAERDIRVVTGGLTGVIMSAKEDTLILRVAPDNIKLEVARSSVVTLTTNEDDKQLKS